MLYDIEKAEAALLMQEYTSLRTEIADFVRYYRDHKRNVAVILSVSVALIAVLGKGDAGFSLSHSRLFWFCVGITITTIIGYFVFDALEAQYSMFAVASRAAVIEELINERAGKALLSWETELSDRFWCDNKLANVHWWSDRGPLEAVKYPSKYLIFFMLIGIAFALFAEPFYSSHRLWFDPNYSYIGWGRCLILFNWIYSLVAFYLIISVAPTVLWRTKKPARDLARRVFNEQKSEFEQRHPASQSSGHPTVT